MLLILTETLKYDLKKRPNTEQYREVVEIASPQPHILFHFTVICFSYL